MPTAPTSKGIVSVGHGRAAAAPIHRHTGSPGTHLSIASTYRYPVVRRIYRTDPEDKCSALPVPPLERRLESGCADPFSHTWILAP